MGRKNVNKVANNRYYLYCECGNACSMGTSLGDGIYNAAASDEAELQFIYSWMWGHLLHMPGGEWSKGELFKVLSEYDDRIRYDNVVSAPLPDSKWTCPECHTSFSQFREHSFPPCPMCEAKKERKERREAT